MKQELTTLHLRFIIQFLRLTQGRRCFLTFPLKMDDSALTAAGAEPVLWSLMGSLTPTVAHHNDLIRAQGTVTVADASGRQTRLHKKNQIWIWSNPVDQKLQHSFRTSCTLIREPGLFSINNKHIESITCFNLNTLVLHVSASWCLTTSTLYLSLQTFPVSIFSSVNPVSVKQNCLIEVFLTFSKDKIHQDFKL